MDILLYLLLFALLALAVVAVIWIAKGYLNGQSPTAAIFGAKPERRLSVVEQASVDGRRRLMLVRRDDVEHLILTGGPVDVVIETGIGERRGRSDVEPGYVQQPVFSRQPRSFGQAGGQLSGQAGDKAAE